MSILQISIKFRNQRTSTIDEFIQNADGRYTLNINEGEYTHYILGQYSRVKSLLGKSEIMK
jgi:hypothetical protein